MANIIEYTNFVLDEAINSAIKNFEKNVKGEFVCVTEKGIRIKVLNKNNGNYTHLNVVPKSSKVTFENLNGSAVMDFNNITKDNSKYALIYYNQINSLRHAQFIVNKMNALELKRKFISSKDNLIDNEEYKYE
ncbi:MAG: hypothetical protein ACK5K7_06730 [Bacilli bacterium]